MYKDVQWKIDLVMKATFSTSALFQMCVLASALATCRENDPRLFNFVLALFIAAYAATLFGTLLILAWAVRKMGFLMRRVSRKDDNGVANPIIDKMNRVLYTGLTTGIPVVLIVVVFFVVPLVVGSLPYFYVLWYTVVFLTFPALALTVYAMGTKRPQSHKSTAHGSALKSVTAYQLNNRSGGSSSTGLAGRPVQE